MRLGERGPGGRHCAVDIVLARAPVHDADAHGSAAAPCRAGKEGFACGVDFLDDFVREGVVLFGRVAEGGVAKGAAPYDESEAAKRAGRVAYLVELLDDGFPEDSNVGEPASKAKAEVGTNRANFDKKLDKFKADARAFKETIANEKSATAGFKSAVALLGQDCKSRRSYKLKIGDHSNREASRWTIACATFAAPATELRRRRDVPWPGRKTVLSRSATPNRGKHDRRGVETPPIQIATARM